MEIVFVYTDLRKFAYKGSVSVVSGSRVFTLQLLRKSRQAKTHIRTTQTDMYYSARTFQYALNVLHLRRIPSCVICLRLLGAISRNLGPSRARAKSKFTSDGLP